MSVQKLFVIKYGGNAMVDAALMAAVAEDIVSLRRAGTGLVLVHGGGPEIEKQLAAQNIESRFVDGLRYTDEAVMDVVQMVLCGKINKNIVALLQSKGGAALGLCGIDGAILKARRETRANLGLVGNIEDVNAPLLHSLVDNGLIPVISPVAIGLGADSGRALNVNADTAAAMIAARLGAAELVLMTDIAGLLRDVHDPQSLISQISAFELAGLKNNGIICGGMIPKVEGCITAINYGVRKVRIIDGRIPHVLRRSFCQGECYGTLIAA
ncbi:MAG: acetylglutamate kinase [Spirochaetaceae bacterium]|jgi:acetylglutamate kinase|nr:acetylglutamate kinase [Spirochaetaceae bacterium]